MDIVWEIVVPLVLSHAFAFFCGYAYCRVDVWGKRKLKEEQDREWQEFQQWKRQRP